MDEKNYECKVIAVVGAGDVNIRIVRRKTFFDCSKMYYIQIFDHDGVSVEIPTICDEESSAVLHMDNIRRSILALQLDVNVSTIR